MFKVWVVIALLLNLFYVIQFLFSYLAYKKLPKNFKVSDHQTIGFSIVVAMRNEASNVKKLLASLTALDYPKNLFEIILVDDFSDDQTTTIVEQLIEEYKGLDINLHSLKEAGLTHNRAFKKTAIQIGVSYAKYEWVVTTDADCLHKPSYLKTLAGFIHRYKPRFISAPVNLGPNKSLFQKMQALEFKGLVGLGAAYLQRDKPFLCNGANQAFQRNVFQKLNGFKGFEHMESGDDIWFMHKVQERYPFELYFAMHPNLIVESTPCNNLNDFINQRKRWTSKNSSYKHWSQLITLSVDYLFYCALLINILIGVFMGQFLTLALVMALSKFLVEGNFFAAINRDIKTKAWPLIFLITFPLQIVYVVSIYPLSQITRFKWKNRTFNARRN